ncbi:MAG: ABC transporter substrate-binding protein, partial [Lachnospiraceae bacterium]|nr:ABC transporter substrate-binding protein [Lachnospiraceae bacterium]
MRHNLKKVLFVSAAAMMALTACSTNETEVTEAQITAAQTTVNEEAGTAEQEKPLVVYLNDFDAVIPDMFKEATGYEVEVVSGNGAETMSCIAAEKGNPQWDVVWIDSMYDVYNLSKEGELMTDFEIENAENLTDFS